MADEKESAVTEGNNEPVVNGILSIKGAGETIQSLAVIEIGRAHV